MRAAIASVLLFSLVGCGIKKVEEKPVVGTVEIAQPSPVVTLRFDKLWDPEDRNVPDVTVAVKQMLAAQYLSKHLEGFLAPAVVGSAANLASTGMSGVVGVVAVAEQTPVAARELAAKWKDGFKAITRTSGTSIDSSSNMVGTSTRQFVTRIGKESDEGLRKHLEEYLVRVEQEIKRNGGIVTARTRGDKRATGPIADLSYETPERKGFIRSVVVRKFEETDIEFKSGFLESAGAAMKPEFVKSMLSNIDGPYLVVLVSEQKK